MRGDKYFYLVPSENLQVNYDRSMAPFIFEKLKLLNKYFRGGEMFTSLLKQKIQECDSLLLYYQTGYYEQGKDT